MKNLIETIFSGNKLNIKDFQNKGIGIAFLITFLLFGCVMPNQSVPELPPPAQGLIETAVQLTLIANGVITPAPTSITGTLPGIQDGGLANGKAKLYLPLISSGEGAVIAQETIQITSTSTAIGPSSTPTKTFTPTAIPPTATPVTPTALPCLSAKFIQDINVPPGTVFAGGTKFTKIWRVQNSGSCPWNRNFTLMWVSGDMLGAKTQVPIPGTVQPGETVDLQIDLVAPKVDGKYKGGWMINDNAGHIFGVGKNATNYLWVEIKVKNTGTTVSKSSTPTSKPANTSAPTKTNAPTQTKTFTPTPTTVPPTETPTPMLTPTP